MHVFERMSASGAAKTFARPRRFTKRFVGALSTRFRTRGFASTRAAAFKAWRGVRTLKRMSNAEIKTLIVNSSTSPTTTTSFIALSQIAQGDDLNQRQGRSIRVTSWKLLYDVRGTLQSATERPHDNTVRMIIFADKGQDGTNPTDAEVRNTTDIVSLMNPTNNSRFQVLLDRLIVTNAGANTVTATAPQRFGRVSGSAQGIHGKHVRYIGTTAAEASNGLGSLYMLLQSSEDTANAPLVSFNFELKYVDN